MPSKKSTTPRSPSPALHTRLRHGGYALVALGMAYLVSLYAFDTAKLIAYAVMFALLWVAGREGYRAARGTAE